MLRRVLRSVRKCCYFKKPCPRTDRIDRLDRKGKFNNLSLSLSLSLHLKLSLSLSLSLELSLEPESESMRSMRYMR